MELNPVPFLKCYVILEVYRLIIIAALQQLRHLVGSDGSGVGAGAGVTYGQFCYLRQLLHEFLLINDAAFIFLNAGRNIQGFIHLQDSVD